MKKIQENIVVYEALRNTVLHCEDGIRNAKIYMYTVYFALMSFGFKYRLLFLISFVVLIAFQAMINQDRLAIQRASSYIRVFFETKRDDMHWSLLNKDKSHATTYTEQYKNIGWYIDFAGASILSAFSFLIILITNLYYCRFRICKVPTIAWLEIVFAILLCGLTIYTNKKSYIVSTKNNAAIKIIDASVEDFYNRACTKYTFSRKIQLKIRKR